MYNILLDHAMAAARQQQLEEEAVHERLVTEALKAHKDAGSATLLERLLKGLKASRHTSPSDPRLN